MTEIHERDTAAEHAARLQEVTAGLAAAATTAEIADVIISQGIPALAARTGILGVLERPDELRFVASVGYGDVFPERLKLDEPWPIAAAVRTRGIIELRDLPERRAAYAVPEAIWEVSGHGMLVAVPLIVRDQVVGALGFTREEFVALTADERRLVETLAGLAAQALERASLYEADRRARHQAEGLQRVSSAVSTAVTMHDVAEAVASEALAVLSASGVTVVLSQAEDESVGDVLASHGTVAAYATNQPWSTFSGGTVTAASIRDGQALYMETLEQLEARGPPPPGWPVGWSSARSRAFRSRSMSAGARSAWCSRASAVRAGGPHLLFLLARTCEQGLLRAALYDAEESARRRSGILQALCPPSSLAPWRSRTSAPRFSSKLSTTSAPEAARCSSPTRSAKTLVVNAIGGSGATRSRWLSSLDADGAYVVASAYRRGEPVSPRPAPSSSGIFRRPPSGSARRRRRPMQARSTSGAGGSARSVSCSSRSDVSRPRTSGCSRPWRTCARRRSSARAVRERADGSRADCSARCLPGHVVRDPDIELIRALRGRRGAHGDRRRLVRHLPSGGRPDRHRGRGRRGPGLEAAAAMGRLRSALAAYALESMSPA